jgi:hypothetical protein
VYGVPGANSLSGVKVITVSPLLHLNVPLTLGRIENASFTEEVSIFLLNVRIMLALVSTSLGPSSGLADIIIGGVLSSVGGAGLLVFPHPVITILMKKTTTSKKYFFI